MINYRNLKEIKRTQKEIRINLDDSLYGKIFLYTKNLLRKINGREILSPIKLYHKQLYNISNFNRDLQGIVLKSRQEYRLLEAKIDCLYSNLIQNAKESTLLEKENNRLQSEIETVLYPNLDKNRALFYNNGLRKSNLERKLAKNNQRLSLTKDSFIDYPKEISLLESNQKIYHAALSKFESVLQKSRHIESILYICLSCTKNISSKKELMKRLSMAFSEIEESVKFITYYTSKEMLNSAGDIMESSFKLDLDSENSLSHIETLVAINEMN